jgi:hypothetical protein
MCRAARAVPQHGAMSRSRSWYRRIRRAAGNLLRRLS